MGESLPLPPQTLSQAPDGSDAQFEMGGQRLTLRDAIATKLDEVYEALFLPQKGLEAVFQVIELDQGFLVEQSFVRLNVRRGDQLKRADQFAVQILDRNEVGLAGEEPVLLTSPGSGSSCDHMASGREP